MIAVQFDAFGGSNVLRVRDVPRPIPQDYNLLLRVTAAGVNFVDVRERQGAYQRAETKVGGVTLPRIPGLQVCGDVVETGLKGDKRLIGQTVLTYLSGGGYAQYVVADPKTTVVLPEGIDPYAAAALPTQGLTAYLMLTASTALKAGESVLVNGAGGGVGSLAIQIAKALGAGTVIGAAGAPEKRSLALSVGADLALDYTDPSWPLSVRGHTYGQGVDIILESVGGDIFEQSLSCLALFGRCIVFGTTRGPAPPLSPRALMPNSQSLTGIYLPTFLARPALLHQGLTFLARHLADQTVRPHVSSVLPLAAARQAHDALEAREVLGTIVLDPWVD